MNIRKVTGENLSKARDRASLLFDNKFVVLESAEPKPGVPASITIAIEESEIERHRSDSKPKKPVHLLKPLLGQFEELFDRGNKSINKFMEQNSESRKETDNSSESNRHDSGSRVTGSQKEFSSAVYFERSNNNYDTYQTQQEKKPEKTPEKENMIYRDSHSGKTKRNHNLNENNTPVFNYHFEQIQQRLLHLELFTRRISNELMPDISGNPIYRHLLSKKFHPELLNHWFSNTLLPGGQPEIQLNQIKKILDEELQPKNPDCEKGIYLFSGLPGSNIHSVVDLLIEYNMKKLPESIQPVLIAEDSLLLKNFNPKVEIPKYTVSDNSEWRQILNREGEDSTIFIITKPLPFDLNRLADKWDKYSSLYDGIVKPEHHFVTHGLFDPEQVIHQLPANHHFKPDYISFSDAQCCMNSPGNFYTYNYYLDTKTGFLQSDSSNNTTSEKIVEWSLKNLNSDDF